MPCAVKIDWNKVPDFQKDSLCGALVEAMKTFYEDPKNMKAYEEWMKGEGKRYANDSN